LSDSGSEGRRTSGRFLPLLVALLLLLFFHLLMVEVERARLFRFFLAAVLAFAAWAVSGRRRVLVGALALGTPAVAAQLVAYTWPGTGTALAAAGLGLLLLLFVTVVVLAGVVEHGPVDVDRIAGAVAAYLLLGLTWAVLFAVLAMASPAAFQLPPAVDAAQAIRSGDGSVFYYFSFVTLTTLGFGDVVPLSPAARTLTWLEAVVGQLYLAILIARLVGLQITQHRDG